MDNYQVSIFNDVIGPVMRGPSSSHVAAAARMGHIVRMASHGELKRVHVLYDINTSLPDTHDSQGSDMGLISGLINVSMTDENMVNVAKTAKKMGLDIEFTITDYGATHPNTYRIEATDINDNLYRWQAISTGGGMILFETYDEFSISIGGDSYELLLKCKESESSKLEEYISECYKDINAVKISKANGESLIDIKSSSLLDPNIILGKDWDSLMTPISIEPVLPTITSAKTCLPFKTASELLSYAKTNNIDMYEASLLYESIRGGSSKEDVFLKMEKIVGIMRGSVKEGLNGTSYEDRILHKQSHLIEKTNLNTKVPNIALFQRTISYITAIMEVKSGMGVIVAAPTAGSCGCLPGTIISVADEMGLDNKKVVEAMLCAGMLGAIFCEGATFSAEVAGCQVECGAGSAMAATGVSYLFGGTTEQCINSASIALQNITGLACDPVAARVEVPCLGKNVMGGVNAISSAIMGISGYDEVIPLDETISAVMNIGDILPREIKCTCGGLGTTSTSYKIKASLESKLCSHSN